MSPLSFSFQTTNFHTSSIIAKDVCTVLGYCLPPSPACVLEQHPQAHHLEGGGRIAVIVRVVNVDVSTTPDVRLQSFIPHSHPYTSSPVIARGLHFLWLYPQRNSPQTPAIPESSHHLVRDDPNRPSCPRHMRHEDRRYQHARSSVILRCNPPYLVPCPCRLAVPTRRSGHPGDQRGSRHVFMSSPSQGRVESHSRSTGSLSIAQYEGLLQSPSTCEFFMLSQECAPN